jgi:predicted DNA-binding transcriptional regulator AlpA
LTEGDAYPYVVRRRFLERNLVETLQQDPTPWDTSSDEHAQLRSRSGARNPGPTGAARYRYAHTGDTSSQYGTLRNGPSRNATHSNTAAQHQRSALQRNPFQPKPTPSAKIGALMSDLKDTDEYLSLEQVLELVGVRRETLWRWRQRGRFPEPVRLNFRGDMAWPRTQIEAWLARRAEGGLRA